MISDQLKAAGWSALFAFIAASSTGILGWLGEVADWASSNGADGFPSISNLGFVIVAGVVAAWTAVLNFAFRFAQAKDIIPGKGPEYPQPG